MKLKLGVPVLNRGDLLLGLIRSIDVPFEALVVVNQIGPVEASVASAAEVLERNGSVKILRANGNYGVAGSWNVILDHFGGGDCVISNSDIEFAPGALEEAARRIATRPDAAMQHLWAAACFYAAPGFTKVLGWFDENIYPAYHEDQEIALRSAVLGVKRCNVFPSSDGKVMHGGSQTIHSADDAVRRFVREAKQLAGRYLSARWGALPPPGVELPEKAHAFGDPSLHAADWRLDMDARRRVMELCKSITGWECPLLFHRAEGGLCS
ncbi:MAG: hypothetical protein RL088_3968 [Verrucomicrobiota bacterium]|jgi:GT2 family glycosyltransferase